MEGIIRQRIENRPVSYVNVVIAVEEGCNPAEGEYGIAITGFIGMLDLTCTSGTDDVTLVKECIENEELDFPKNGELHLILKESGEWEDVFWHKYYVIERSCKIEY